MMDRESKIVLIKEKMAIHNGIMKTGELYEECSLNYHSFKMILNDGVLKKVKNGYYALAEDNMNDDELIAALFSDGVLCLESALYYHGYIKDKPFQYHIAIDKNTSKSRFEIDAPVVVPYYTEPEVLTLGVTVTELNGLPMKIYDKDRMICDILKYENKLPHELVKNALFTYIMDSEKNVEHLLSYAIERKVKNKVQNRIGAWL